MANDLNTPPVTWSLADPGMDLLERAGLAGLYMTLRAATDAGVDLSPLRWTDADLTADSVTVRWDGPAKPAFVRLMQWAWQVRDGVMYFPAVHDDVAAANWHLRVPAHNGLMRTYFQNPNVQPALDAVTRVVQVEEERRLEFSYKTPGERVEAPELGTNKRGKPQTRTVPCEVLKPHRDTDEKFFDAGGLWRPTPVTISNWIYPGIAPRFTQVEDPWVGAADRGLLLMLAPTVCLFQKLQGAGGNWVIVVPDVRNLDTFDAARRRMSLNTDFVDVASLGDAGLRFLAEYSTREPRADLQAGCRVIGMGNVTYYQNQSIRKSVLDVSDRNNSVRRYRVLQQVFPNQFQRRKAEPTATPAVGKKPRTKKAPDEPTVPQGNGWYKLPTGRGRIADNLVTGRPWYRDLFVPMPWDEQAFEQQRKTSESGTSAERVWFTALTYQRSRLMRLVNEPAMWDSPDERLFVDAFWETLDSLYAQEAEAVSRGGERSVQDRFEHMNEDIRRRLMQAKTRVLLRAALAELFAKAGRQRTIRAHTPAIWRLIDHPDFWRKGRDLALLALASHRNRDVREGKKPDADPTVRPESNPEAAQ